MTEFERIEAREIDGLAWAIRSTVHQAAFRREQPSAYVAGILATMQSQASRELAAAIQAEGLNLFRHDHSRRAELAGLLKRVSEDQAQALRSLGDQKAARRGLGARLWRLSGFGSHGAGNGEGASTGRKSTIATNPPESPSHDRAATEEYGPVAGAEPSII